jgi:hypothetical protein
MQEKRWKWGEQGLRGQQQQDEELVGTSSCSSSCVEDGEGVISTHMLAMSAVNARITRSQATRSIKDV